MYNKLYAKRDYCSQPRLIINDKGEILILQRSETDKVLPGYWDIPGGTLNDGEDPIAGVIRETKEETGFDILNPNFSDDSVKTITGAGIEDRDIFINKLYTYLYNAF